MTTSGRKVTTTTKKWVDEQFRKLRQLFQAYGVVALAMCLSINLAKQKKMTNWEINGSDELVGMLHLFLFVG